MYVLRLILHDWTDADSIAILSNIRAAIGTAKATLVIAEVQQTHPTGYAGSNLNKWAGIVSALASSLYRVPTHFNGVLGFRGLQCMCCEWIVADAPGQSCAVPAVQTAIQDEFFDPLMQRGLLDVHMMVATNGAERTVLQWCGALVLALSQPSGIWSLAMPASEQSELSSPRLQQQVF